MLDLDWTAAWSAVAPHLATTADVLVGRVCGGSCAALSLIGGGLAASYNWRHGQTPASKRAGLLVLLPAFIVAAYGTWSLLAPTPDLDPYVIRGHVQAKRALGHGAMDAVIDVLEAVEVTPDGPGAPRPELLGVHAFGLEEGLDERIAPDQDVVLLCHVADACIGTIEDGSPRP
ncbi:MAG: hypothetical protein H6735_00790 [Alphaproteobacteria bacterium]|nr:hypothetical protein [Alphaproteobacteria bacterium]